MLKIIPLWTISSKKYICKHTNITDAFQEFAKVNKTSLSTQLINDCYSIIKMADSNKSVITMIKEIYGTSEVKHVVGSIDLKGCTGKSPVLNIPTVGGCTGKSPVVNIPTVGCDTYAKGCTGSSRVMGATGPVGPINAVKYEYPKVDAIKTINDIIKYQRDILNGCIDNKDTDVFYTIENIHGINSHFYRRDFKVKECEDKAKNTFIAGVLCSFQIL
jgi:hypothetical protein